MKLFVRTVAAMILAIIVGQASAQTTITVAGASSPFTASANYQTSWSRTTATSSGTLRVGFDLIIDKMSVTLKNVTQTSATSSYGGSGQQWGLGANRTGFSITSPGGTTRTLIPTGWMNPDFAYGAISNFEIVDATASGTSILGRNIYCCGTSNLSPAAGQAVQSYDSFAPYIGTDAVGPWQLNVQSVDDYQFIWNWAASSYSAYYYAMPHNVTVNTWNLNFQGKYAVAAVSTTQLFQNFNVILGKTQQQCFDVSNIGTYPLQILNAQSFFGLAAGDYKVLNTFPITVAPGSSISICVTFTPQDVNARIAQFTLTTSGLDASVSPVQSQNFIINLFGTGVAPVIDAQFKNVLYRSQVLVRESVVKYFKVRSAGNAALVIGQFDAFGVPTAAPGAYIQNFVDPNGRLTDGASEYTIFYPPALAAGGTYQIPAGTTDSIGIAFTPKKEGTRIGLVVIRSNAVKKVTTQGINSSDSVAFILQGVGLTPHIAATAENFGSVNQGETALAHITIHNVGSGDLKITSQTMNEGDYKQFKIITPFPSYPPAVIKPDSSATMVVQFKPDSIYFLSTRIRLVTNCLDNDSARAFDLQGIGRAVARASFAPKQLFIPDTGEVGGAAVLRTVTVTNTGGTPLVISSVKFGGRDSANYSLVSGSLTVQPGKASVLTFAFTPQLGHIAASNATATILSNNSGGGSDVISLFGFACQKSSQSSAQSMFSGVVVDTNGDTRQDRVVLSNPGNCPVVIKSISLTGVDANLYTIKNPQPQSLAPGGNATVTVEFKPNRVTMQTPIASLRVVTDSPIGTDSVITLPLLAKGCFYNVVTNPGVRTAVFGATDNTVVGGTRTMSVALQNTGCIPLSLTAASMEGPDADNFAVTYTPTKPIPPGGIDSVVVKMTRKTAGKLDAKLRVSTNSTELGDLLYPMFGPPVGVRTPDLTVTTFALFQNYPNPFNPSTRIMYDVAKYGNVRLEVLNSLGQIVSVLENGAMVPGRYSTTFDASNLPSGMYFSRLTAEGYTQTRIMNLLK